MIVRKGIKEDIPQVLDLIRELAEYEKALDQVSNTVERLENDGFGKSPVYDLFVAEAENKIIGMGGILDSSRFKTYISKSSGYPQDQIEAMVIGGHGDTTMIPLTSLAKCNNKLLTNILSEDEVSKIASDTMVGGATLTKLLGTSAWYAPGASVSYLVNAIVNDTKEVLPCSVLLEGEYGAKDICIGVPVKIGKNGFEEVVQLDLNNKDLEMFQNSVSAVKETNSALDGLI